MFCYVSLHFSLHINIHYQCFASEALHDGWGRYNDNAGDCCTIGRDYSDAVQAIKGGGH